MSAILRLAHILAAFAFVSGYIATNLLTELARRNSDLSYRRSTLALSDRFDRVLNAPGGTVVGLTGLLAIWGLGYSIVAPWILAAIVLFVGVIALGAIFWRRVGLRIGKALADGDTARLDQLLRDPRNVAVSRIENLVMLAIIVLMVLRPTF